MCQSNSLNQRAVVEEGGMGLVRIWVWGQTKDTMQYLYFESEEVSGLCTKNRDRIDGQGKGLCGSLD
jgi:hypothetical protein